MKNETDVVGTLIEKAEAYGETNIELIKLKAIETAVHVLASLSIRLILLTIFLILVLMLNIAIALWIGEYYGKVSLGFFIMTGIDAIVLLVIFLLRKSNRVEDGISNLVLNQIYRNKNDETGS